MVVNVSNDNMIVAIRLLIFTSPILIFAYFCIFNHILAVEYVSDHSLLNSLFRYVVAPLIFSSPWIYVIISRRERIELTFVELNRTGEVIPLRWRIFYGINALFIFLFFILPLLSPLLAFIFSIFLAMKLKKKTVPKGLIGLIIGIIYLALISSIPILLFAKFLVVYLNEWLKAITSAWNTNLPLIYDISIWVVNSLAVGALLSLIYTGAADYEERIIGRRVTYPPIRTIRLIETVVFLCLFFVGISMYEPFASLYREFGITLPVNVVREAIDVINIICLAIITFVILIKIIRGLSGITPKAPIASYIFVALFLLIEVVWHYNHALLTLCVIIAFMIFAIMFIYCYIKVEKSPEFVTIVPEGL